MQKQKKVKGWNKWCSQYVALIVQLNWFSRIVVTILENGWEQKM